MIALMMKAPRTSQTSVNFYQTTRRHNPEDSHLHTRRRESLKSYNAYEFTINSLTNEFNQSMSSYDLVYNFIPKGMKIITANAGLLLIRHMYYCFPRDARRAYNGYGTSRVAPSRENSATIPEGPALRHKSCR
jgi:hypothetical protein